MRCIIHDTGPLHFAHDGQRAHVADQVVISKRCATFGHQNTAASRRCELLDHVLHVVWGEELPLLTLTGLPLRADRDQKVGLAAQKCWNLQMSGNFLRLQRLSLTNGRPVSTGTPSRV